MAFVAAFAAIPATRVQYRCGACGQLVESESDHVPQCAACATPLCDRCNFFGLCQSHYERLTRDDQIRLQNLVAVRQATRRRLVMLIAIPLLGGLVALALGFYFGFSWSFGGDLIPFLLMGVITFSILILAVGMRYFRNHSVQTDVVREIAQKAQTRPPRPRPTPHVQSVEVSSICPHCGALFQTGAQFCVGCGLARLT